MSNVKKLIVENLKNDLDIMSTPHAQTGKTNLWDFAVSINRTNPVPLDKSSIIFEDGENATTITAAADEPTAYPGQIISGLKGTDGKVYVLQPDNHQYKTHRANLVNDETIDAAEPEQKTATYEELAFQSTVNCLVNEEIYNRKVSDNARRKSDEAISSFIGGNMYRNPATDVITGFKVPDRLSDQTATPAEKKSILDFIQATVEAEVDKRYKQDKVLLDCINALDLSNDVITTSKEDSDGILVISLSQRLRVNDDPLTKYNNEGE